MKTIVAAALLVLPVQAATAEKWKYAVDADGYGGRSVYFVDADSIGRSGNLARFTMQTMAAKGPPGNFHLTQHEADCATFEARQPVREVYYDGKMTDRYASEDRLHPTFESSAVGQAVRMACGARSFPRNARFKPNNLAK
jgi:hypothetical protein